MGRDEVQVHKNAKREQGQYPAILTELTWSIKDLLYGIKNTERMIFVLVCFQALKRKPVIWKGGVLFSLFSFSLTLSVFLFFSSIPTEKSLPQKIHYFVKENFCAPAWTSAKFYCENKTGNPEQTILAHLASSGSQSEHRIRLILPTRGACHIINIDIDNR